MTTSEDRTDSGLLIQESVPAPAVEGLAKFLETHYLTPHLKDFQNHAYRSTGSKESKRFELSWVFDLSRLHKAQSPVIDSGSLPTRLVVDPSGVRVEFGPSEYESTALAQLKSRIADDIEAVVTSFLAYAKRTSLYFVFSTGDLERMEAPDQAAPSVKKTFIKKIFAGNAVNLYLLLTLVSFVLIFALGYYALIAMLVIQAITLFYADRLVMGAGSVRPSESRQEVTIVRVLSTPDVLQSLAKAGRTVLPRIREELLKAIPSQSLASPETALAVQKVLNQAGVNSSVDDIEIKTRNPYSIVSGAAEKFNLPVPRITIVNTPVDNAAATGISPGHSSITITAGALEDLNDDELTSIVGHEMGHVKGHDPIILFCVTSVMYLGGLFLWLPVLIALGFFYFLFAFAVIYLVGKFLETRADTESVRVLGRPDVLASALTAIGFSQLYYERYSPPMMFFDWLRFDPHPPIYFRIQRLSSIARKGRNLEHTLLVSIEDVISGFFKSLAGM